MTLTAASHLSSELLPAPREEIRPPILLGAHVESADPLGAAKLRGAEVVQIVMGSPRVWKTPLARKDAELLRESDLPIFAHAPYLINICSPDPQQVARSRQCLAEHAEAAASIGARGLVVHGGHVTGGGELEGAIESWVRTFQEWVPPLPILIENTAGGQSAVARRLDGLKRLWEGFEVLEGAVLQQVGFCLDTCHAHAGGMALSGLAEEILAITGRIDLVHVNDSKDGFDSGRDRHTHLGEGMIAPEEIVDLVAAAGAPAVVETADGPEAQAADIAWLRDRLS